MESSALMTKKPISITTILVLIMIAGLSLMLYPTVSNYWNSFTQSRGVTSYSQDVEKLSDAQIEALLKEAEAYNASLPKSDSRFLMSEGERAVYNRLLRTSDAGIIGTVEIPRLKSSQPIYHGTAENTLQVAIGHLEGSSLPVGGAGTHTILSGHRGLPSAKLFTGLEKMEIGDRFMVRVLNRVLTYEVDQLSVVDPDDFTKLQIEEGKDYCTLVTCTPYGINTHRLLVRGVRVENGSDSLYALMAADATMVDPRIVAACIASPVLLGLVALLFLKGRRKDDEETGFMEAERNET